MTREKATAEIAAIAEKIMVCALCVLCGCFPCFAQSAGR